MAPARSVPRTGLALLGVVALVFTVLPPVSATAEGSGSAVPDVVISQVYGGGGNSGATFSHDFVELFNRGDAPQDISGWSLQYTSSSNNAWGFGTSFTGLSGTIPAGGYHLVQMASNDETVGDELPEPDGTGPTNLAQQHGKIALVASADLLERDGDCPAGDDLVDAAVFGSTDCDPEAEGKTDYTWPALGGSASAAWRLDAGCSDELGNVSPPQPRNSSTPLNPCGVVVDSGAPVVISQLYGAGGTVGATLSHDYVELLNRSTEHVDLDGWRLRYAATGSTGNWTMSSELTGTIPPGGYFLVQLATTNPDVGDPLPEPDATGGINMAIANGKIALVSDASLPSGACPVTPDPASVVDFVGYGTANCFEGEGAAPGLGDRSQAAFRLDDGCQDTDDNAADFVADSASPRNSSSPANECGIAPPPPPPPPGVELECPTFPVFGVDVHPVETFVVEREVSASVPDATVTELEITEITPTPEAGTITVIEVEVPGAPGEPTTATYLVDDEVPGGRYATTVTATADDGREGTCDVLVDVTPLVPIGEVQGVVPDDWTGGNPSQVLGQTRAVRGVITQNTLDSSANNGLFLQNRPEDSDDDPRSSDGVFVFIGSFSTLRTDGEGPATGFYPPVVGDEIVIRGPVGQFFGMTQFGNPFVYAVEGSGADIEDAVAVAEVDPPDDAAESLRYFRRHLGMQLEVPAESLVVGGRDVFAGTDAEVWAIRGDHPVAQREAPYERRVFRDAHPLDNNPKEDFDDGNGYRFVLGSFGLKASEADSDAVLAPAKTFDTITEANRGGVYLSFGKYTINVRDQLALDTSGTDPADNHPVQAADRAHQLGIAAYNVENLYDLRDNPNSTRDFPPQEFDYVPDTEEEYQGRLVRMADQIIEDLHGPDIVMIQETEAQDVCTVSEDWDPGWDRTTGGDRLDCDLVNTGEDNTRSDGRPDSLLELALVIAEQGGPEYDAVFDLDSGDARGITVAYLYRTDRVELLEPDEDDPVLGATPTVDYDGEPLPFNSDVQNPKALNAAQPDRLADTCTTSGPRECDGVNVFSRAPQVGLFRVWRDEIGLSSWTDVYLVNNHHSAGPDRRVFQRREQATYNARIAEAILATDPDARVLVGGDLNVFPRPDDPFRPGQPIALDEVGPSDQLAALYESPLTNLYDTLVERYASAAYSFGFQGQAQTLDHLFVSPSLLGELVDVRSAKINVDWPADAVGEEPAYGRFGVSDHDPEVGTFDVISFDRIRALLGLWVEAGLLDQDTADGIASRLDAAERFRDRGQLRQAENVLTSIVRQARASQRGSLDPSVAEALVAEIEALIAQLE